ncbi:hypothetical protein CYMTET_21794 [Cymbomonas tetramitiformis]|uniref:Uncharacterized protein n=1 Tax=Cymbomonas tetramitiformis TaxID=36881 RepID=A0AAE0L2V9_9CHLO|nr:hypothetical protein CYMTET_21794 [Cymbomonas tetramitiformis]
MSKSYSPIRQHQLGESYFDDSTDVSKLAKVIVALRSELATAGLDCDVFDLDQPNLGVQRFVNELVHDTLSGWFVRNVLLTGPTRLLRARRPQLWENLDPVFYAAIKVKYPRIRDLHAVSIAELSDLVALIYVSWEQYAGGTPGTAAAVRVPGDDKAGRDDDILEKPLSRLDKIEAFIKTQRMGGAPAVLPKRNRKGFDGFRVGVSHDRPACWLRPRREEGVAETPVVPHGGPYKLGKVPKAWLGDTVPNARNHSENLTQTFEPLG